MLTINIHGNHDDLPTKQVGTYKWNVIGLFGI